MGPPLWVELRRQGAGKTLRGPEVERLLKGKKVAVDGAVWLYEAQTQADVVKAYGAEGASLKVTFERCVRWLRKGILPVVVLEGTGGGRANRTFSRGRGGLGSAFAPQPRVHALLVALGIPCIIAEGEAEATCAALAAAGHCDFVATTDFDALLFGAPRVLRGLDLLPGVASKCEVWDADTIEQVTGLDRHALVAAAFLVGCDYDCRSESRSTSEDGKGVRGVGARGAVKAARALRHEGCGDALQALSAMVSELRSPDGHVATDVDISQRQSMNMCAPLITTACVNAEEKAVPSRVLNRTMSVCIPVAATATPKKNARAARVLNRNTSICIGQNATTSDISDPKERAALRMLTRTISKAAEDPRCREGFAAAVRQYNRVPAGVSTGSQPFAWTGINDADAEFILNRVYPGRAYEKLDPLHLEWALRVVGSECPAAVCRDPVKRRSWALARGLRYVPLTAKKPSRRKSIGIPYVLVEFALASGDVGPVRLPAEKKHARVSLAEACKLLNSKTRKSSQSSKCDKKQRSLKDIFKVADVNESRSVPTQSTPAQSTHSEVPKVKSRQLRMSLFRRRSVYTSRARATVCSGDDDSADVTDVGGLKICQEKAVTDIANLTMLPVCASMDSSSYQRPVGGSDADPNDVGSLKTVVDEANSLWLAALRDADAAQCSAEYACTDVNDEGNSFQEQAVTEALSTVTDADPLGKQSVNPGSEHPSLAHEAITPVSKLVTSAEYISVFENNAQSSRPRDTTRENIAGFFGRSWTPVSHNALCATEAVREYSQCPNSTPVLVETMLPCNASRCQQAYSMPYASPSTPRSVRKRSLPETQPEKRRRRLSLGGFCRLQDKVAVSKGSRGNARRESHVKVITKPVIVDLTEVDATDSEDDLPLSSLVKRCIGLGGAVAANAHCARYAKAA